MPDTIIAFEKIINGWSLPVMVLDRDLRFVFCNDAYLDSVLRKREDLMGKYVFDAFPDSPERVADVEQRFRKALAGETTYLDAYEYELRELDGTIGHRIWQGVQEPLRDEAGQITYMIQRAEDVTEQYKLKRQNDIISQELDHRVKNLMTIVQAIAHITSRRATSVTGFVSDFLKRMGAMSRTYNRLSNGEWQGLSFKSLFDDELEPYKRDGEIITYEGEDIFLSVKSTKDASLIIHELATNAAKYGCFSEPTGRLHIKWWIDDGHLHTVWSETGLSGVVEPTEMGFGSSLFKMMPNATVTRTYRDEGLLFELSTPVTIALGEVEFASA